MTNERREAYIIQWLKDVTIQNDRIERMLKWLIIERNMDDFRANLGFTINEDYRPEILDELFRLDKLKPDISDIIKDTK